MKIISIRKVATLTLLLILSSLQPVVASPFMTSENSLGSSEEWTLKVLPAEVKGSAESPRKKEDGKSKRTSTSQNSSTPSEEATSPKREFRGAWIQTVFQYEYAEMDVESLKQHLVNRLDALQKMGINTIIFQVRPEADAWYNSTLEPWSRFITGTQGEAPKGGFDPMEFLIMECHARCMEFHAWLNPYRAASDNGEHLAEYHVCKTHPEWFFTYNNFIYFNPALPECREFFCGVLYDIVSRYDVDAIHIDDYFYPYPVAGLPIPDEESFKRYGRGFKDINDWRRDNVNLLIQMASETIKLCKPWVRFGVSPFGIYRNVANDPDGSDTHGLQNYDDLYADILLWTENGWVDYNIPQLYWEIGHPNADYAVLLEWWKNHRGKSHMYIGLDVARTMKAEDLTPKMSSVRESNLLEGYCFWPANELLWNNGGVADSLKENYFALPALNPSYSELSEATPEMVSKIEFERGEEGMLHLSWGCHGDRENPTDARYFVVYIFPDEKNGINFDDPERILAISPYTSVEIPYDFKSEILIAVTALNRYNNESEARFLKISKKNLKRLRKIQK